jgi:hypothetical protein
MQNEAVSIPNLEGILVKEEDPPQDPIIFIEKLEDPEEVVTTPMDG